MAALAAFWLLAPRATPSVPAPTRPELPRTRVDAAGAALTGSLVPVPSGADLQAALDRAQPGDVLVLEAGATFTGPFTLPSKPGSEWIVLRTSREDGLPPPGSRVGPA